MTPPVRVALIHYHEIGLKGFNRSPFERRLQDNVRWALREVPDAEVERIASRVLVRVHDDMALDAVARALGRTPGISYAALGIEVEQTPEAIEAAAVAVAQE